ncbi:tRNA (cytidine/uridine-2'-O-)-methyltransferase [Nitratiruptor sp. YY08-26]|uniref:tRNA (cytidine(34)-2'-O)-methyltransferase n=1 Tax=unclassified Nitratiruptor TaxID=2624044 RepID=UPI001915DDFB|nr:MULTISPECIES: tRNA (cytidine(34)-2'-O)-methyltransferase [unclassified Nitratiruptor]BCD62043.1 tRNA (cytidine/uridine-2'-O-)-methyltransferase [Nitratiruptor sp. YY08-13]BCD65979.1 tRNA (cytidine/uridine-2'-O-)-methyltransferase [Nitratiruptor sp. YY08-26]
MFNVVLVHPQIPPNTGNIGRLCVNTGARLHLIKPLGFDISEKSLKRAGLDYWHKLDLTVWESLDAFLEKTPLQRCYFATTKASKPYFEAQFKPGDYLLFGSETKGLPMGFMQRNWQNAITIPMTKEGRSLNLAVSVGVVLYEAIRQNFEEFG